MTGRRFDRPLAGGSRLDHRIAVVVGGGTSPEGAGNGAAFALTYARAGAAVIVADRDADAAQRSAAAIHDEGLTAHTAVVDVSDPSSVQDFAEQIHAAHGAVDILHNNVGIVRVGALPTLSESDWSAVIDTNLTGTMRTCSAFLPGMIERRSGVIINTSSVASLKHTGYRYSAYYAAKAGLDHLTRTLAVDLAADGVRVNAVLPGMIDTPLVYRDLAGDVSREQVAAERAQAVPMRRMGSVWEVAAAAAFLASDAASYITGVCLAVDGGLSLT